jgi:type I restriction enzyme S subunit
MGAEWVQRRIGDFSTRKKVINENGDDLPPLSVTKDRGVILQSEKYKKRVATDPQKYVIVEEGDFAFDPMSLYYGALGRVTGIERGLISPDYVSFSADSTVDAGFLEYLLRSQSMIRTYETVAQAGNQFGKRRRVYWSVLQDLLITIPSLAEQRRIAAVLSAVDDVIDASGRVIEQTKKTRHIVVQELLRDGVQGHSAHRNTDIGTTPSAWRVAPLDEVLEGMDAGWSPQCDAVPACNGEWGVLKVSSVSWGSFRPAENKRLPPSLEPRPEIEVQPGDIIVSRANTPDLVGRAVFVRATPPRLLLSDKLLRLRPARGLAHAAYLNLVLGTPASRQQIEDAATGSSRSMKNISQNSLRRVLVPVPPIAEQEAIVAVVEALDLRVEKEEAALTSLKELRVSLGSALLSAEIRVSGARSAKDTLRET